MPVEHAIPADAECLGCGYALRDLPDPRCPECGRAFDPAIGSTMHLPAVAAAARRTRRRTAVADLAWVLTTFVVGAALVAAASLIRPNPGTVLMGVVGGLYAGARVRRALAPPRVTAGPRPWGRRSWARRSWARRSWARRSWAGLFAVAALTGGNYYECVHGTLVGLFGVGLAHSELGGPCHNGVPHNRSRHLAGDWYLWWEQ